VIAYEAGLGHPAPANRYGLKIAADAIG